MEGGRERGGRPEGLSESIATHHFSCPSMVDEACKFFFTSQKFWVQSNRKQEFGFQTQSFSLIQSDEGRGDIHPCHSKRLCSPRLGTRWRDNRVYSKAGSRQRSLASDSQCAIYGFPGPLILQTCRPFCCILLWTHSCWRFTGPSLFMKVSMVSPDRSKAPAICHWIVDTNGAGEINAIGPVFIGLHKATNHRESDLNLDNEFQTKREPWELGLN